MEYTRSGIHTEWDTHGVGYTWNGIHMEWDTRSETHREWDTHGVGYTWNRIDTEWDTRSGIHVCLREEKRDIYWLGGMFEMKRLDKT